MDPLASFRNPYFIGSRPRYDNLSTREAGESFRLVRQDSWSFPRRLDLLGENWVRFGEGKMGFQKYVPDWGSIVNPGGGGHSGLKRYPLPNGRAEQKQ